jgi:NAD(P) transhydrogenase subunit alpha
MVERMQPGAVIIDVAAESGGNCELTQPGEKVEHNGVTIYGPINLPSELAVHASEMYAKNLFNFVALLTQDGGTLAPDWSDEILAKSVLIWDGEVKHAPTKQLLEGGAA